MKHRNIALALVMMLVACREQTSSNTDTAATISAATETVATNTASTDTTATNIYPTFGVHNPPEFSPCANPDCLYVRGPGEPPDPTYPQYWQSQWTMYRVYKNYRRHMPPYKGRPPDDLKEGVDYEVSYGASYYDSTWRGPTGEGAMMEHYEKRCLPIFPISNHYTCSFISLGDVAFFVTPDDNDRPKGMPPVCLFSPLNHPPRRDFISHLPYAKTDSAQLGPGGQAYSFWIQRKWAPPFQVGATPDQTLKGAILFGYAFAPVKGVMQPSSFYFSGYPFPPANAPVVSQNYTDWAPTKPDPEKTWAQVSRLDWKTLPPCHLFPEPAKTDLAAETATEQAPTWGDIGRSH